MGHPIASGSKAARSFQGHKSDIEFTHFLDKPPSYVQMLDFFIEGNNDPGLNENSENSTNDQSCIEDESETMNSKNKLNTCDKRFSRGSILKIVKMYEDGFSIVDIAQAFNAKYNRIRCALKKANVNVSRKVSIKKIKVIDNIMTKRNKEKLNKKRQLKAAEMYIKGVSAEEIKKALNVNPKYILSLVQKHRQQIERQVLKKAELEAIELHIQGEDIEDIATKLEVPPVKVKEWTNHTLRIIQREFERKLKCGEYVVSD